MRRFRVRPDSIERKLRHERPQPTDDLIQRISASVGRREPRTRWNFAVAFALTVLVVTAFALTGGVSYASSAAKQGAHAVSRIAFTEHNSHSAQSSNNQSSHNQSGGNNSGKSHGNGGKNGGGKGNEGHGNNGHHGDDQGDDDQGDDDGPGDDQYRNKVLICHKPGPHQHTLRVPQSAVPAHLAHGDTLGACPKKNKKH